MRHLAAFGSGALFGVGLLVAGMTNPAKIVGFLDLFGRWDASLAFVMVGAIAVHFVLRRLVLRRAAPLFDTRFHAPTLREIEPRLVAGAALFGVGWALAGYCPGPGIVALASGSPAALLFVAGMTLGIVIEQRLPSPTFARLSAAESGE